MKWIDFMRYYDKSITDEIVDFILWNETAFPFTDLKTTVCQIRRSIRAAKNKINRCDLCGNKIPFHHRKCMNKT